MNLSSSEPLTQNYNVAPTQPGLVILNESPQELQYLRWGLVPHWSKDPRQGAKLINARREGIATKPSFRVPLRQRRCLVLADSFYEWRKSSTGKLPYRILRTNKELLVMAGLWEEWRGNGQRIRTFTVITTEPNAEMRPIHNRMPVLLLGRDEQQAWLNGVSFDDTLALLQTPPDGCLQQYRVGRQVNSVKNNGPSLHEPVNDEPLTLFLL